MFSPDDDDDVHETTMFSPDDDDDVHPRKVNMRSYFSIKK